MTPTPNMTSIPELKIGKNLRQIRKSWGWTLPELMRRSGVSKGNLSKIENDPKANVTIGTLVALANALEVEISDFITP